MSIFNTTFSDGTKAQIAARQNANEKRNSASIQYLNSRTAWIRMTSAVDVNGSNKQASDNILLGGALYNNNLRAGVGTGASNAYSIATTTGAQHRLGMRPTPGITSMEVKTKSAYGSLREVTVNFNCWDIKQLEELEVLYMRQGYTALVEWGWVPYLDNNGNLSNIINFTDGILDGATKEEIFKIIYDKASSSGNYDAVYGKITDYSWKARSDGGYDCKTVIITINEIVESLKINYGDFTSFVGEKGLFGLSTTKPELFEQKGIVNSAYMQNKLAGMITEAWYTATEGADPIGNSGEGKSLTLGEVPCSLYRFDISTGGGDNSKLKSEFSTDDKQIYIALKDFVALLNKYILLHDLKAQKPFIELSVNEGDYAGGNPLLCLGNKLQFSVDPTVCLIKNTSPEVKEIGGGEIKTQEISAASIFGGLFGNTTSAAASSTSATSATDDAELREFGEQEAQRQAAANPYVTVSNPPGLFLNIFNQSKSIKGMIIGDSFIPCVWDNIPSKVKSKLMVDKGKDGGACGPQKSLDYTARYGCGWQLDKLVLSLRNNVANPPDPSITHIFILVGTNENYTEIPGSTPKIAMDLIKQKYPNAKVYKYKQDYGDPPQVDYGKSYSGGKIPRKILDQIDWYHGLWSSAGAIVSSLPAVQIKNLGGGNHVGSSTPGIVAIGKEIGDILLKDAGLTLNQL